MTALRLLVPVARLALGGLFVAAGVLKLRDPSAFATEISNFQLVPALAPYLAVGLPPVEILAGLLLVAAPRAWRPAAALVITALMCLFVVAVGSVVARGIDVACGCFGKGTGAITAATLLERVALLAVAIAVLRFELRQAANRQRPAPSRLS